MQFQDIQNTGIYAILQNTFQSTDKLMNYSSQTQKYYLAFLGDIYSNACAAGILLHKNGKSTMGKLKSSLLS